MGLFITLQMLCLLLNGLFKVYHLILKGVFWFSGFIYNQIYILQDKEKEEKRERREKKERQERRERREREEKEERRERKEREERRLRKEKDGKESQAAVFAQENIKTLQRNENKVFLHRT